MVFTCLDWSKNPFVELLESPKSSLDKILDQKRSCLRKSLFLKRLDIKVLSFKAILAGTTDDFAAGAITSSPGHLLMRER